MNDNSLWVLVMALACGLIGAWIGGLLVARQFRQGLGHAPVTPVGAPVYPDAIDELASSLDVRFDALQRVSREAVERLPQALQQALQVEFDYLGQQQAQRDAVQTQRAQERHDALRLLIASLKGRAPPGEARSAAAVSVPTPASRSVVSSVPAVSARPPELLLTPLPQPAPVYDEPSPERVLSDEEIDALPPDLPTAELPRRRLLPTPKKPVLRKL